MEKPESQEEPKSQEEGREGISWDREIATKLRVPSHDT